jgi:beta-phosphoglucomutase-like phosphatase (HAD superfamily)
MNLNIPPQSFSGYIFDCDGTLAHTMPLHYKAWLRALEEVRAPFHFDEHFFYELGGTATAHIVTILNERFDTQLEPSLIAHRKELHFMENLHTVQPIPEVVALAREAARSHPVSIVSGGFRRVVDQTLHTIGILDLFPVIITPEDVLHGKPAPDMFLLAARKMGVPPEECLVFEDGMVGIQGAERAGMKTVFIPSRI